MSEACEASPPKKRRIDSMEKQVATLLPVPFVHLYGGGDKFYVRECYAKYYDIVEKLLLDRKKKCVTVTGTPGIGKSVFYAYFCDQFRKKHTDMWVVAASFLGGNIHLVAVFKPGEDPVYEKPHRSQGLMHKIMEEATHANVQVVHLYDGPPSTLYSDNLTVVFTSPNEKWLRQVEKDYCTYYMPLWTLEELQEAAVDLGFSLSDSTIEERFETFGGEARHCLSPDSPLWKKVLRTCTVRSKPLRLPTSSGTFSRRMKIPRPDTACCIMFPKRMGRRVTPCSRRRL